MSGKIASRIRPLFSPRVRSKQACQRFLRPAERNRSELVRLPNAVHTAIFSPTGGGKGVSMILPFLMDCPDSMVVCDIKGENALLTARLRQKKFGHRIVLLDPFNVVTKTPDCFNPLDFISKHDPMAIDECKALAKALVVRQPDEREPHWNDSAEAWISAVIATTVQYGELGDACSLQGVRAIMSNPKRLETAVQVMCESDCWEGMLARMGGQLSYCQPKELSSVQTTVARFLGHLDTLAVVSSTKASSFNPADLCSGRMTVYLILPPAHLRSQSALLRMWIGSLMHAVVRGGLGESQLVHFVLDEAASLGHLEPVDDALDKFRGYGIRLLFAFQSLGQLRRAFPEGQEQTLLSNTTQVFFGTNDYQTAEYISNRTGDCTVIVDSGGSSHGTSTNYSHSGAPQTGGSDSYNSSRSWQQQARRLLKPEEVLALPADVAITFATGMRPIRTWLIRYYEENVLWRRDGLLRSSVSAFSTLVTSLLLCGASLLVAIALTLLANDEHPERMPDIRLPEIDYSIFDAWRLGGPS